MGPLGRSLALVCAIAAGATLTGRAEQASAGRALPAAPGARLVTAAVDPGASAFTRKADAHALREIFGGASARRWHEAPELVILTSVMQYGRHADGRYQATADTLTENEANDLAADLAAALAILTAGTFPEFAEIRHERIEPGRDSPIMRPGQIVAGRFRDVQKVLDAVGYGGLSARRDGRITSGAVLLDDEYDRRSPLRSLLRAHELGHALGYHHVHSRASIMNPRIGSSPTDFDRRAAHLAFAPPGAHAPE